MKGFINIIVLVVVMILGYSYYKKNYTAEAIAKKKKIKEAEAEQNKTNTKEQLYAICHSKTYGKYPDNEGLAWSLYQSCTAMADVGQTWSE